MEMFWASGSAVAPGSYGGLRRAVTKWRVCVSVDRKCVSGGEGEGTAECAPHRALRVRSAAWRRGSGEHVPPMDEAPNPVHISDITCLVAGLSAASRAHHRCASLCSSIPRRAERIVLVLAGSATKAVGGHGHREMTLFVGGGVSVAAPWSGWIRVRCVEWSLDVGFFTHPPERGSRRRPPEGRPVFAAEP